MSSPVNAQLDKQFQEQEKIKGKEQKECLKLFEKAQYRMGDWRRYYVDNRGNILELIDLGGCRSRTIGNLNNKSESNLIKIENRQLVEYTKFLSEINRRVLGTKR